MATGFMQIRGYFLEGGRVGGSDISPPNLLAGGQGAAALPLPKTPPRIGFSGYVTGVYPQLWNPGYATVIYNIVLLQHSHRQHLPLLNHSEIVDLSDNYALIMLYCKSPCGADVPTVYSRWSNLQRFWTSNLKWTARRRCFGADTFKFPAPT